MIVPSRLSIDYNDIMKLKSCSQRTAVDYLSTLRASLQKPPRCMVTIHEVCQDLHIDLEQTLQYLDIAYKKQ